MNLKLCTCLALLFMLPVFGCTRPVVQQASLGRVYLLPGVEGGAWQLTQTVAALREARPGQTVEAIEWGRRLDSFGNLTNLERNRRRAARIAEMLSLQRREHPDEPIQLVGYSGGGGLALLVAEALPDDVRLERLILIGAAVSPEYDLSKALARVRAEIVNFRSRRDWLFLGWGTRTFGTIDRVYTDSAGRVGFRDASGAPLKNVRVLDQPWQREWISLGHDGTHLGWLSHAWARHVLAHYLEPGAPAVTTAPAPGSARAAGEAVPSGS